MKNKILIIAIVVVAVLIIGIVGYTNYNENSQSINKETQQTTETTQEETQQATEEESESSSKIQAGGNEALQESVYKDYGEGKEVEEEDDFGQIVKRIYYPATSTESGQISQLIAMDEDKLYGSSMTLQELVKIAQEDTTYNYIFEYPSAEKLATLEEFDYTIHQTGLVYAYEFKTSTPSNADGANIIQKTIYVYLNPNK